MKQQFLVDTADTFQTYVYENNRKITPSSATVTVFMPGSTAKLVDAGIMTIGSDGLLSYNLTSVDNAGAGSDYKASITYAYNAATYYVTLFYDIVRSRLVKVITDADIVNELPQLKDSGWRVTGTAESGSAQTIVDSELMRYEDEYFTGGLARCLAKDETREVTAFTSSTGTVTTIPFTSAVSAGESYVLTRSYSREIQRAFEKIEEKIIRLGKRPELVVDPYDLREVHIYSSVAEVCKGLITESDTFWWEIWKEYERKTEETFKGLNFKYDTTGDGNITGVEAGSRLNVARTGRR